MKFFQKNFAPAGTLRYLAGYAGEDTAARPKTFRSEQRNVLPGLAEYHFERLSLVTQLRRSICFRIQQFNPAARPRAACLWPWQRHVPRLFTPIGPLFRIAAKICDPPAYT
jgi:hypothetical protein